MSSDRHERVRAYEQAAAAANFVVVVLQLWQTRDHRRRRRVAGAICALAIRIGRSLRVPNALIAAFTNAAAAAALLAAAAIAARTRLIST